MTETVKVASGDGIREWTVREAYEKEMGNECGAQECSDLALLDRSAETVHRDLRKLSQYVQCTNTKRITACCIGKG